MKKPKNQSPPAAFPDPKAGQAPDKGPRRGLSGGSRDLEASIITTSDDDLLDPRETARELNCSKSYLDKLRCYGGGPPFLRIGRRMVRYRRGDARNWANSHRFNSTSEYKS